jgi:acyl-CoA reductase-like NAD-dependent aldehyde dehydrogenase
MVRDYDNWIDGCWIETPRRLDRFSPADGRLLSRFADSDCEVLDLGVKAARAAFDHRDRWPYLPGSQRAQHLTRLADLIVAHSEKLSEIESEEAGKPIRFARAEVAWAAELIRYAAALAWQIPGDAVSNIGEAALGLVTREPRGVVGIIVPWNFPLVTLFQKLAFALAAGCTTVIKPSELTSGTALEVAILAKQAGFPDGVINVVTGTGVNVGDAMTSHPGIDMISFTGSTAVGKHVARRCADSIKRVGLELGGKAANIVFPDADLDAAVDGVLLGYILNQGQECVQGTRLLVHADIAKQFVEQLVDRSKRIRLGLPMDESADMGPLIHDSHMNGVLNHIRRASTEGARLAIGGYQVADPPFDRGCFVTPTVFDHVTTDMALFRDEVFGPVLAVTTFSADDEAVTLANYTGYGLGNGVWTKDIDRAVFCSRRLKSGTVYVNTYLETSVQMPFGGFKESGMGRENGMDGLLEFTETKSTFIKLGNRLPALPHTVAA